MSFQKPEKINIFYDEKTVQGMKTLCELSVLPEKSPIPTDIPWKLGIEHSYLKHLKEKFVNKWSWAELDKKINRYDNYMVQFEDGKDLLNVHFVYARSSRSDAIPLMLLHGWPGSFFDFHKVIGDLISPENESDPAFHVVIPSLPGFFKSTLPDREGWTIADTARVFHGLMTEVLGYPKFVVQAGDWGSHLLRVMAHMFPDAMPLLHFNAFAAWTPPRVSTENISDIEKKFLERREEYQSIGSGYVDIQSTKPLTIGLAIAASPLSLLAYIGQKIYVWSDPVLVDEQHILDTVALYFLSGSFASSVLIYHQSQHVIADVFTNPSSWGIKSKIGYSAFPYEINGPLKDEIKLYGDLVFYNEHKHGGHFPAVDSPKELMEDLRTFISTRGPLTPTWPLKNQGYQLEGEKQV